MENNKISQSPKKLIKILSSLVICLCILTLTVSGTILIASMWGSSNLIAVISQTYLEKTGQILEGKLDIFFRPVAGLLLQTKEWGQRGLFQPEDLERFRSFCIPILSNYPQITSICTGDESGFSHRIGYDKNGFLERVIHPEVASQTPSFYLLDRSGAVKKEWEADDPFDARKRDWYSGIQELSKGPPENVPSIFWAKPMVLHTSKTPGITASLRIKKPEGTWYVLTFNLMLTKISNFSTSLSPSQNGKTFILSKDGEVLGLPNFPRFSTTELRKEFLKEQGSNLPKIDQLGIPLLSTILSLWKQDQSQAFRFSSQNKDWHAQFRKYKFSEKSYIWVGLTVPEDDFMEEANRQQTWILLIGAISFLLSLFISYLLARMYSRPLAELAARSDSITNLELTPKRPVHSHIREIHLLSETQERMLVALDSFSKYVPLELVKKLLKQGRAAHLGGHETEISVMFCDIRGFTTISESMTPEALSEHVAVYFESMMDILLENHATIDKMIGDAIMALWGAPLPDDEHAVGAVLACLRCKEFLKKFNEECEQKGLARLDTGFGINTGKAMVGNFGARNRMNYTALGDTVNLASRLEGINKLYGTTILATEAVKENTKGRFVWRLIDLVAVKGKVRPEKIFEPLGEVGSVPEEDMAFARIYETAFQAYLAGKFSQVKELLAETQAKRPKDLSIESLIHAAESFVDSPPPDDWRGIRFLRTK